MMFQKYIASVYLFVAVCSAVCCKNYNKLCFIDGIDCEPNCDDGVSKCNLSGQTCRNDSVGGCIDNVVKTATITNFPPLTTVTAYMNTTTVYTQTSTNFLTTTTGVSTSTVIAIVTKTHTATATQASVVPRGAFEPYRVFARAEASTVSTTITIVDVDHCRSTTEPACTTTISMPLIVSGNGSAVVTSVVGVASVDVVTVTSTMDVTTTVAPGQTAAARQGNAATGTSSSNAASFRLGNEKLLVGTSAAAAIILSVAVIILV